MFPYLDGALYLWNFRISTEMRKFFPYMCFLIWANLYLKWPFSSFWVWYSLIHPKPNFLEVVVCKKWDMLLREILCPTGQIRILSVLNDPNRVISALRDKWQNWPVWETASPRSRLVTPRHWSREGPSVNACRPDSHSEHRFSHWSLNIRILVTKILHSKFAYGTFWKIRFWWSGLRIWCMYLIYSQVLK